jgi:outer membrane protein insertion porin family
MFKGVLFCDYGTVEEDIRFNGDNFRVAPGFGFRVHMPVGGAGGAPLAFDFAFPVAKADTDDTQVFSFYMGVLR